MQYPRPGKSPFPEAASTVQFSSGPFACTGALERARFPAAIRAFNGAITGSLSDKLCFNSSDSEVTQVALSPQGESRCVQCACAYVQDSVPRVTPAPWVAFLGTEGAGEKQPKRKGAGPSAGGLSGACFIHGRMKEAGKGQDRSSHDPELSLIG